MKMLGNSFKQMCWHLFETPMVLLAWTDQDTGQQFLSSSTVFNVVLLILIVKRLSPKTNITIFHLLWLLMVFFDKQMIMLGRLYKQMWWYLFWKQMVLLPVFIHHYSRGLAILCYETGKMMNHKECTNHATSCYSLIESVPALFPLSS